jgi:hypothetical protein
LCWFDAGKSFVIFGGTERFQLDFETEAVGLSELAAQPSSNA